MAEEGKGKPLTREDVLRRIKENGGTAKGLDLSGKVFEEDINLSGLELSGIKLQGASLFYANLKGADLVGANLQCTDLVEPTYLMHANLQGSNLAVANLQGASFQGANLQGANLASANLQRADFAMANLQDARLWKANLRGTELWDANLQGAMLEDAKWDPKYIMIYERQMDFYKAEQSYRNLKRRHTEQGLYGIAGEFFFRELTVRRKTLKWWPNPLPRVWSKFLSLICGYGEKPLRVIAWAASVILVSTLIYFLIGSVWEWSALWQSLYFSAVSFTALGYGSWLNITNDWIRGLGAFESFIGVFSIALFLITFVRKMTR